MPQDAYSGPRDGRIVILTGAGISKESGLDTFRDADGIWATVNIEDVATPEAFQRDPDRVHAFYNDRRRGLLNPAVRPNAAHLALARLEAAWPGDVLLVTQNIDNLHERAGSKSLVHMHGELLKARCQVCAAVADWPGDMSRDSICRACATLGTLRVHVVRICEMPFEMDRIYDALAGCALFVSIGTSGNVYPAAGFVQEARGAAGAHTVEINLEPSQGHSLFVERRYGPAGVEVPDFVERLLGGPP